MNIIISIIAQIIVGLSMVWFIEMKGWEKWLFLIPWTLGWMLYRWTIINPK
jgi:hypothetical protein